MRTSMSQWMMNGKANCLFITGTSMIRHIHNLGQEGKAWRIQDVLTTRHHLKTWKVMLWVMASLLTRVNDVFSQEAQLDILRDLRQTSWAPEPESGQNTDVHIARPDVSEKWSPLDEEIQQGRWRRSPHEPNSPRTSKRNHKTTMSGLNCHLERKEMRVRDLGLGYDSDEIVIFKYCVGTCHSSRRNYDLALKTLTDYGSISGKINVHPCCRPTRYETVSFMDTQTSWQTVRWLSAASCSCVG